MLVAIRRALPAELAARRIANATEVCAELASHLERRAHIPAPQE